MSELHQVNRPPVIAWPLLALSAIGAMFVVWPGIKLMATWIALRPEYGHGLVIPFVAAFLIWKRKSWLSTQSLHGSWTGALLVLVALAAGAVGVMSSVVTIQQYAYFFILFGLVASLTGWQVLIKLRAPLLMLLFMVPLPEFLYANFSAALQLISSQIGVWVIRLFGISVYLEGNVIDLGTYKLQVAEACDGLRYLFPLMTIGFIAAYMYHAPMWKRIVLFASTIPITILMNSARIGVIGITVNRWGVGMAEGVLHSFQGWMIFMCTCALLLLELILLSRIGKDRRHWRESFGIPESVPVVAADPPQRTRSMPLAYLSGISLVLFFSVLAWSLPTASVATVPRDGLDSFPVQVGAWESRRTTLDKIYLDILQMDDYLLANFYRDNTTPTNLYIAWYNSQEGGRSIHSPRSCLPGGGWRFDSIESVRLAEISIGKVPLRVNRVLISLGNSRQLVYYWFQQRGRVVTNEYAVKWYLFWDGLTRRRSDGALIRLVTPVPNAAAIPAADAELSRFAAALAPLVPRFVPD
jgi:exosortase D (VPLPA-CTERM-specific)